MTSQSSAEDSSTARLAPDWPWGHIPGHGPLARLVEARRLGSRVEWLVLLEDENGERGWSFFSVLFGLHRPGSYENFAVWGYPPWFVLDYLPLALLDAMQDLVLPHNNAIYMAQRPPGARGVWVHTSWDNRWQFALFPERTPWDYANGPLPPWRGGASSGTLHW